MACLREVDGRMTSPPCAMLAEGATLAPITTPPSEALAEQKRPSAWPSTDTEIAWDTESYGATA